jgi:LmbE family N-acetylglucosaminyl deacetylase
VRSIRKHRPDVVIGCDPTNLFVRESYINHPDHRAAGQVVVDAIMPAAGNHLFFRNCAKKGLSRIPSRSYGFL